MTEAYLKILAKKFFDGIATEEEKKLLHSWYDENLSSEKPEIILSDTYESARELKQSIFSRLKENLPKEQSAIKPLHSGLFRRFYIWAASAAASIAITFFTWDKLHSIPENGMQIVHAPFGKTVSIQLPDGSKLWLNSGSTITFPKIFSNKLREVTLTNGQAFFDVVHESKRHFIVHTKNLDVTVLGTSFDVKAYGNDVQAKVSVKSGKVGVTLRNNPKQPAVMLLPDRQFVVQNKDLEYSINKISAPAVATWKDNRTILEDELLSEVFHALEREYNQHIVVENEKLSEEKISVTLDNQPLTDVLKVLSFSKKFNYYQLNDSTIVIR
jgi:transmembrane sensor